MGSIIQMAANTTGGDENALAAIDVPRDGVLLGVEWNLDGDLDADADVSKCQLSFGTQMNHGNDARQVISNCKIAVNITTSGASQSHANHYASLPEVPVFAGERIYLHASTAASLAVHIDLCVHFSFNEAMPMARRR